MRRWMRIAMLTAAVTMFGTHAAVASDTVGWKVVDTNSSWHCGGYVQHSQTGTYPSGYAYSVMRFKACTVVNASGGAQTVLVVQNDNNGKLDSNWYMEMGRVIFESQLGGDVWCAPSNLAPGATRGCFGPTVQVGKCRYVDIPAVQLKINGHTDEAYGVNYVKTPCF
ncbi:hypothetical protein ACWCPI_37605 [Streptomyces sp. NPDC001920]